MGTKKELKEIKEAIKNLEERINEDLQKKARRLTFLEENLQFIHLNVDKVSTEINTAGEEFLRIEYKTDPIDIMFDENGEPLFNKEFYAINILDLLGKDEMAKLSKHLKKFKKKFWKCLQKNKNSLLS